MHSLSDGKPMSLASLDCDALTAYVQRSKAAWREAERNKTWEEKVEAIVRMRERDKELAKARERNRLPVASTPAAPAPAPVPPAL